MRGLSAALAACQVLMLLPANAFLPEITFQTSRSSGPGGQNVNKVESRVELRWHLLSSQVLTPLQKQLILEKLAGQLTTEGYLLVVAQDDRSQLRNKEIALARFYELLQKSLRRPKPRRATRPSAGAVRKRLEGKKIQGEKKANRRRLE
jgi:ribosome-associated protein